MKTPEQKDHETDLRMKREYGKSLAWYNEQFGTQNGGCSVCGDGPGTRRLNIDHDHKWKSVKVCAEKTGKFWKASATYLGSRVVCYPRSGSRRDAVSGVREILKSKSVRGLLCHRCNRAMILFRDSPALLRQAIRYLEKFQKETTL